MNELGTRLEHAEARVEQAQEILDAVGHTLAAAERAQSGAERFGSAMRSVNVALLAGVVALGVVAFVLLRRSEHHHDVATA